MAADLNEPRDWRVRIETLEAGHRRMQRHLNDLNRELATREDEAERGRASEGEPCKADEDGNVVCRRSEMPRCEYPACVMGEPAPTQPSPGPSGIGEEPEALTDVIAACEHYEDEAYAQLARAAGELAQHEVGFFRGQKITAKRLRNIAGDLLSALRAGGRAEQQRAEIVQAFRRADHFMLALQKIADSGAGVAYIARDALRTAPDSWPAPEAVAEPRKQPEELPTLAGTGAEHIEGWAQDSEPGYLDVYGDDWFRATRSNPLSELNDPPLRRITLRLHRAEPQVGPDEALPARLMEVARSLASVNEHSAADDVKLAAARLLRGARNETLGEREGERRQYCARCHYAKDLHPVVIENWPDEQVDCKNFVAPSEAGAPQEAKP